MEPIGTPPRPSSIPAAAGISNANESLENKTAEQAQFIYAPPLDLELEIYNAQMAKIQERLELNGQRLIALQDEFIEVDPTGDDDEEDVVRKTEAYDQDLSDCEDCIRELEDVQKEMEEVSEAHEQQLMKKWIEEDRKLFASINAKAANSAAPEELTPKADEAPKATEEKKPPETKSTCLIS